MKKVLKLTAISLIALTITVGHAFLCYPIKAATSDPQSSTRLVFSFETNAMGIDPVYEVYLNCDVIFSSNALTSGQVYFTYTPKSGNRIGYGMTDGSGTYDVQESGTSPKTITVSFANTTYFVYRFQIRGDASIFTQNVLNHPVNAFSISFGSQNLTYGNVVYSEMYQYNMMNYYLQSIANDQASIVSAMQSVDGTIQDILDEVQQINQSLSQQQQQQVDDLNDQNDSLASKVDNFGNMEQQMNQQFNVSVNQFESKYQSDLGSLGYMIMEWNTEMMAIKDVFESFIMVPQYMFFIAIPLVLIVLKRIMGN